jgi:hypothetical protein
MNMMDKWGKSNIYGIYGISRLGNSEIHPAKRLVCSKQFDFTAKPKPHRDTGIGPTRKARMRTPCEDDQIGA